MIGYIMKHVYGFLNNQPAIDRKFGMNTDEKAEGYR